MIIKVTDTEGQTALVDNDGQRNGEVVIQGDAPLVAHLDLLLNRHLTPHKSMASKIEEKYVLHTYDGLPDELYKASNLYLQERFIAVDCPLFDYTAEIVKE